jgi:hypothetical protein
MPDRMATLAPALLYFAPEAGPMLLRSLRKGEKEPSDGLGRLMSAVQEPMEREIEGLLRSAASEIEGYFPTNAASRLAQKAPWGTIRLFNGG